MSQFAKESWLVKEIGRSQFRQPPHACFEAGSGVDVVSFVFVSAVIAGVPDAAGRRRGTPEFFETAQQVEYQVPTVLNQQAFFLFGLTQFRAVPGDENMVGNGGGRAACLQGNAGGQKQLVCRRRQLENLHGNGAWKSNLCTAGSHNDLA
jgi:hypothetical protein